MDSCAAARSYHCRSLLLRRRRRVVDSFCSSSSSALSRVRKSQKFSKNEIFGSSRRSVLLRHCKASSSSLTKKIEEDNGAVGPEIQITGQEKTVHVKFVLQKACLFGQNFFVVGNSPTLGLWDPKNAFPLEWSEGHVWIAELDLPVGKSIEFKFILKSSSGMINWQPGPDRVLHTYETANTIVVSEDWENMEDRKVIEEPLSYEVVNGGVVVNETEKTSGRTSTDDEEEPPTYEGDQVLVPGMLDSSISSELRDEDSNCEAGILTTESQAVDFNELLQQEQLELPTENVSYEEKIDKSPEESDDTFLEAVSEASEMQIQEQRELPTKNPNYEENIVKSPKELDDTCLEAASEASEMQIQEEPESLRVLKNDIHWGHRTLHQFLSNFGHWPFFK